MNRPTIPYQSHSQSLKQFLKASFEQMLSKLAAYRAKDWNSVKVQKKTSQPRSLLGKYAFIAAQTLTILAPAK